MSKKQDGDRLLAGAAMADITPKAGTHLAGSGMGEHRPAQSVLDPLHAKAVVFESEEKKLCFVSLDTTMVLEEYATRIREEASKQFGFDFDAVMVHATQTHSAPSCGNLMLDPDFPLELPPELEYLRGGSTQYSKWVSQRAVEAIGQASQSLQPVQIGVGSGVRADLAGNRRGILRDGSMSMPWFFSSIDKPLGPTEVRYLEGPIDPEVGALCMRTDDMRMVGMLLHYTCHPVNVFVNRYSYYAVSADWPGAWSSAMQETYGSSCVPLVLNGCCGNINPWDPFQADFIPDHKRQGAALAETARKIVSSMKFSDNATLDWRVERIPLPFREVPPERQKEVDKILADHPEPKWSKENPNQIDTDWFLAAATKSIEYCRKRSPEFMYEIQVFRIGDTAFVGLPGEPFVEGQLAIKIGSPAYPTYVAHGTSQYVGYLPTKEACANGGHEANPECTYWAKLAPEALDLVVENSIRLLGEMFS